MAETNRLKDPWMVGVWPGMGSIALIAGDQLIHQLQALPVGELDVRQYFELHGLDVSDGIAKPSALPRTICFEWKDPNQRHDLIIVLGEAQPASGGFALCQRVIEYGVSRGAKQVFTFAAMAAALAPGNHPKVFGLATDTNALEQLTKLGVDPLPSGQIGGLNGLLLVAATQKNIPGSSLLGEMPFFAAGVANPRAASAVLTKFGELAEITLNLEELNRQADMVDQRLLEMQAELSGELGTNFAEEAEEEKPMKAETKELDSKTQQRIESLFEKAAEDRSKAIELKQELDRLGIFKKYENRFLDLFRTAG
jgi:proteasome assembly chaperone (PAC2) family protein